MPATTRRSRQVLFEQKCLAVPGRDSPNVGERRRAMNVRPERKNREPRDGYRPGAAFAREAAANEVISAFVGFEYIRAQRGEPAPPGKRGDINADSAYVRVGKDIQWRQTA